MINVDIDVTRFLKEGHEIDTVLTQKMRSIITRIDQGEKPSSSEIKKALKTYNVAGLREFLERVFKKCVFCEVYGNHEIEHYRPKLNVRDVDGKKSVPVKDNLGKLHSGYYWLAFEITNFLWVCRECNAGKGGKHTKFPINGQRLFHHTADEMDRRIDSIMLNERERPLLLNPLIHSPQDHVYVDIIGKLVPVNNSIQGGTTIQVCNLNRYGLFIKRRKKIIDDVCRKLTRQIYRLKKFLKQERRPLSHYQKKRMLFDLCFGEVFSEIRNNQTPNSEFSRVYHRLFESFKEILDSNEYAKEMSQKDKELLFYVFRVLGT